MKYLDNVHRMQPGGLQHAMEKVFELCRRLGNTVLSHKKP